MFLVMLPITWDGVVQKKRLFSLVVVEWIWVFTLYIHCHVSFTKTVTQSSRTGFNGYFIYNHGLRVCVGIPNVGSGLSNHA